MTKRIEAADSLWRLLRTRLLAQPITACIMQASKTNLFLTDTKISVRNSQNIKKYEEHKRTLMIVFVVHQRSNLMCLGRNRVA